MKKHSLLLAFMLFLAIPLVLTAQDYELEVTTLDSSGQSIEFTAVQINDPAGRVLAGGYTDSLGFINFSIPQASVMSGLQLRATMVGFQTYNKTYTGADLPAKTTIVLEAGQLLRTVEVTENRQRATATLDGLNFRTNGSTEFGTSGYEVLQNIPGVSVENGLEVFGRTGIVYVNGKPSKIPAGQISQFLKSKSALTIAEIEVVSQPGSGIASGIDGTIINIITTPKSGNGYDLNGYTTLERRSKNWSQFAGAELNSYSRKFSSTLNVNANLANRFSVSRSTQLFNGEMAIERSLNNEGEEQASGQGIASQYDAEYRLNDRTYIVAGLTYNRFLQDDSNTARTRFNGPSISSGDSTILFQANPTGNSMLASGNIGLVMLLDSQGKRQLFFDVELDHSRREDDDLQQIAILHDTEQFTPVGIRQQQTEAREIIFGASVRYQDRSRSENSLNYGAGINRSGIDQDFSQSYNNLLTNSEENTVNQLQYEETIIHAYGENRRKIWGLSVRAGLRVEYSDIYSTSLSSLIEAKQTYLSLFPNLSIGKRVLKKYFLSVGYRRSIVRPTFNQLTPFNYFDSNNYFFTGNPFLLPFFQNRISLNAQLAGNVFVSASYSRADNRIVEIDIPLDDASTFAGQKLNNGFSETYQLSLSHGKSLTKKLRFNFGLTATRGIEFISLPIGAQRNRFLAGSGYLNINLNLSPRWSIGTNGYYSTAVTRGSTRALDFGYLGGNIVYNGKGDRFSVKFSGRDLLLTGINRSQIVYDSAERFIRNNWDSRLYAVTASFNVSRVNEPVRRNSEASTANEQIRKRLSQ